MQFVVDGERTPGIEIVERLLATGERYEGELSRRDAESALEALEHLELPWLMDEMVESGEMLAAQVHSQASRGLQEAIQNAEDQRATHIRFGLRKRARGRELLIAHDGNPVAIYDVVSMAYPLLSGSRADPEKIGRFGVGLKTLNQLSDSLAVHCPPLPGFEIKGARISRTPTSRRIPGFWNPDRRETLFVLRLVDDRFDTRFFKTWLSEWQASSLVFLTHLHDVRLVDLDTRRSLVEHRLTTKKRDAIRLPLRHELEAERVVLQAGGSRAWTRYSVRYPTPKQLRATHKALGETVRLSIAVPHRDERNRLYVGLPLEEECDLPFSLSAPFDPNVDRTHIRDHNVLNSWLFDRLGDLAVAVCLHRFAERPSSGWRCIPLDDEQVGALGSWLWERSETVVERIRERIASRLRIDFDDGTQSPIGDLVFEDELLDGLLTEEDVEHLYSRPAGHISYRRCVPGRWRDSGRWREVLENLDGPARLSVANALRILDQSDEELTARGRNWLVKLTGAALQASLGEVLWRSRCITLQSGDRTSPLALEETGALLVSKAPHEGLAATLRLGHVLAPPFRGRPPEAKAIREWLLRRGLLRERPTDFDALRALAGGSGDNPRDLRRQDMALARIRAALEQAPADAREALGEGVGRNVLLSGFTYVDGDQVAVAVRPVDAYLPSAIDKNEGWPSAAGSTAGVTWIDRRYAKALRTGRDARGQGALGFLRMLGAATAPRIVPGPEPNPDPNAYLDRRRLPAQQAVELSEYSRATGIMHDTVSPDLDRVLDSILRESKAVARRSRARALFLCLDRAWSDRREPYSELAAAEAVRHYRSWHVFGDVSATWLARLASEPWMSSRERTFQPKAPRDLTVLTDASFEVEGENPEKYAYELDPEHADLPFTEALGIQGRPWASSIVERLEELRDHEASGQTINSMWVERCYRALASYVGGGRYAGQSNLTTRQLQACFGGRGTRKGLVRWNGNWLSPAEVRRGPYLAETIPTVGSEHGLWQALGVRETDIADCVTAMKRLSALPDVDVAAEARVYRRILELLPSERRIQEKLRGLPMRTYQGWITKRSGSLYGVPMRAIAAVVGSHWPVWDAPLSLDELAPLIERLGVDVLGEEAFEPNVDSLGVTTNDLQEELPSAVTHLRDYLFVHHPDLHESIPQRSWHELVGADIMLGTHWRVRARAGRRRPLDLKVPAYLFRTPTLFCAVDESEAAAHDAGGQAIASFLLGPEARSETRSVVSLAWAVAFGRRREAPESYDVEPTSPAADDGSVLVPLPSFVGSRKGLRKRRLRSKQLKGKPTGAVEVRELISLEDLDLSTVGVVIFDRNRRGKLRAKKAMRLKEPRKAAGVGGTSTSDGTSRRNYNDREREDTAYRIIEAILSDTDGLELEDLRDQSAVGADAVDRNKDIWIELKAHGRDVSDTVRLESSEALRAEEKREKFWLVVAWDLEKSRVPQYVIVPDPLRRLDTYLGRGLLLTGISQLADSQATS